MIFNSLRFKRLMTGCIALAVFASSATGCSPNASDQKPQQTTLEVTTPAETKANTPADTEASDDASTEATEETPVAVDIDGGSFSNEDLIYFIVTDRFKRVTSPDATSKDKAATDKAATEAAAAGVTFDPNDPYAYHGGDLKGVTASLDYIQALGATAIWLTPVQKNGPKGYHGYWIHDFWTVDPHLGTLEDLKTLVAEAHKRDMKVMLDYVVNHTGYDSPWLNDPQKKHWFNPKRSITNWNDEKQLERGWLFGLPDLNLELPEVEQFFVDNALWWIRETGIDGMRLDTVKHVPKSFWINWSGAIKTEFPDFYLIGEVWTEHVSILEKYRASGIDGVTNYPLYEGLTEALSPTGKVDALALAVERDQRFEGSSLSGIFVDNHDNSRLISKDPKHGLDYLKLGITWAYTYPAIPVLYYGTEVGLPGGKDPDNRRDMPWNAFPQPELLSLTKALAALRPNLGDGYAWLYNDAAVAVYRRGDYLVAMNFSAAPVQLAATLKPDSQLPKGAKKLDALALPGAKMPSLSFDASNLQLTGQLPAFGFGLYPLQP